MKKKEERVCVCVDFRSDWPIFQTRALRLTEHFLRPWPTEQEKRRVRKVTQYNECYKSANMEKDFSTFVIFATCLEI